jgi:hypothetical protein
MFWVNKGEKNGNEMEAIAVGSVEKVERNEKVCTVTKLLGEKEVIEMNGHATTGTTEKEKQHDESAPGAPEDTPTISEPNGTEEPVIQEGEVIPASRPEPVSFVTANEGLNALSLNEKSEPLLNGNITGPHSTLTANLLDPNVNPASDKEDAHTHHEASDTSDPATGGGVEQAAKAYDQKVEVQV